MANHTKNLISKALLGAHFSVAGGLEKAIATAESYHCRTLQIFTKNARSWQEKMPAPEQIRRFKSERSRAKIKIILSHASYLINMAANDPDKLQKSSNALSWEMIRAGELGIDFVVLHPGAYLTSDMDKGISKVVHGILDLYQGFESKVPRLLFETTAGQGTQIGYRFEHLARILAKLNNSDAFGICLDTSHMFASGYDLSHKQGYRSAIDQLNGIVGLENVFAIHVNDSKTPLGSKTDRHEHIGQGCIGLAGFAQLMKDPRFEKLPKILETPKLSDHRDMDRVNLETLALLTRNKDGSCS